MNIKKTAVILSLSFMMAAGSVMAAGLPAAGSGAMGEMNALAPVFPGVGPVIEGTAPLADSVKAAAPVPVSEMGDLFLNHVSMPKNVHYEPLGRGDSAIARHLGMMTVKGKTYTAGAVALGATFKGKESDEFFGGMFLPRGHTREAGGRMLAFNMGLLKLESAMNEVFLQAVDEARRETGEKLPYNFLTVDMVHVEQLHSLKGSPKTYSFSIRPAFSADGFLLPLFIRGFASKVGDSYRFLFLAAPDSQKDMVSEAGLSFMKRREEKNIQK